MAEEGRMKAIVIFDSKYGNCEKVAEDIAAGLAKEHPGGAKIVEPELSVLVTGMKGPIEDGAMDKAREFDKKLAEAAD